MREYDEYRQILELWELGIAKKRIAITLSIPRATVRDCIERYGNLEGLEQNKERASRSTPEEVLKRICDPEEVETQKAYAYTLGIYLGDGYIVRNKRVYFIRIALGTAYPDIIEHCYQMIQTLLPDNKVNVVHSSSGNSVEVVCTYKFWPDLFPQHGAGKKHDRDIVLQEWQQLIIDRYPLELFRGLYHSDGCRFSNIVYNRDYPRYQFSNSSEQIRRLFCHACHLLGLRWTENMGKKSLCKEIFISKRPDVAFLDQHIGPKS